MRRLRQRTGPHLRKPIAPVCKGIRVVGGNVVQVVGGNAVQVVVGERLGAVDWTHVLRCLRLLYT